MIVGIDYGTKRIGLAISESGVLATPLDVVANPGSPDAIAEAIIERVGREGDAELYVLGVPSGNRRDADEIVRRFEELADVLRQKSCRAVVLHDEAYSTTEAASLRRESGGRKRRGKDDIDMRAAAVILQSWLDERERGMS